MDLPKSLLTAPFQISILTGSDLPDSGHAVNLTPQEGYGLWHFLDGAPRLRQPSSAALRPLPTGCCYLVTPRQDLFFHIPRAVRYRRLSFALRFGPRRLSGRSVLLPEDGDQPQPGAFLGCDLPFLIPEAMQHATTLLLESTCALWWRDVRSRLRANARLMDWLLDLLELLDQGSAAEATAGGAGWVLALERRACQALGRGLDVNDLVRLSGWSRAHLHRRMLAECRCTPGEFLDRLRSRAATTLLDDARRPITGIAHEVGFRSPQSFARWFRRHHGCSPRTWHRRPEGVHAHRNRSETDT